MEKNYIAIDLGATPDPAILEVCGVSPSLFPGIVFPGAKVGVLKPEFGLGPVPVVAVAGRRHCPWPA